MTVKNKRILFIITQSEMGGAQRFLYNLLTRISGKYDVMVATGFDGGKELNDKLEAANIKTVILDHLRREISPTEDIKACFEIKNLINKFQPDDLFLLSSKAGFIGSLAAKYSIHRSQLRVIYRIGGWTFNDPWPNWKRKLWIMLEKKSAHWKDLIIVNNVHDLEQAHKLKIEPREKIIYIPNGVDPYKLQFLPRDEARFELFKKLSRQSGRIFQAETVIGTIANLYPTKGLEFFVETAEYFKKNDEVIFIIFGEGRERAKLEKLIQDKDLTKKVFLMGEVPNGHRLMTAFDIFLLSSVKEGFPWALIEAMTAKIPVVATRVGAVPEIIEQGKNGFIVEPGNPAVMAGKVKEILASDHLYKEFAIQGHQTILFKFSEDKMVKEIESVL